MAAIRNILNVYEKADSAKKVDIIIRNYPNFLGIVDGYTEGLRYMIENEKAFNRKRNHGDLGVRVQKSGKHSDITADTAINNVITTAASCFSEKSTENRGFWELKTEFLYQI